MQGKALGVAELLRDADLASAGSVPSAHSSLACLLQAAEEDRLPESKVALVLTVTHNDQGLTVHQGLFPRGRTFYFM